jgi:septal ring factor EnvC (AmiA/AmiB activator)
MSISRDVHAPARRLICSVVLASGIAGAADVDRDGRRRELESVQGQIRSVRETMTELKTRKDQLSEQLGAIEKQYGQLASALKEQEGQARAQERQVSELNRRKSALRDGILQHHRTLVGQVRAAYIGGRQEKFKLALARHDPARFSRVLTYYGYLNQARFEQLRILDRSLADTRALEANLQAERARLSDTLEQIRQQQARLEESRRQRKTLMAGLERELRQQGGKLKSLRDDAQHLRDLIAALPALPARSSSSPPNPPGHEEKGKADDRGESRVGWPVQGALLARFGSARLAGQWDGVLIGAREGTPVRAVARGRIVFADWLRGYGLLTIVDHGGGHLSLYGFNQSLYKSVGDWVEAGDTIASVGASGGQSEPGLYFGVRENGRPINPLQWSARY